MLCERLTDPARLGDRRYVAEPKLDGQRAQFHVEGGRAVACYSRPGLDLLRHAGMVWLRELVWPFDAAVLDGEACAGDGHKGIQAVFAERKRPGGDMSLVPMPNDRYTGRRRDADGRIGTAVLGGGASDKGLYVIYAPAGTSDGASLAVHPGVTSVSTCSNVKRSRSGNRLGPVAGLSATGMSMSPKRSRRHRVWRIPRPGKAAPP